jgi:hypothetical protein
VTTVVVPDSFNRIGRLDLAARARLSESSIPRTIAVLAILTALCIVLSAESTASRQETVALELSTVGLSLTILALWLRLRYALHLVALVFLAFAIEGMFFRGSTPHTAFGWVAHFSYPVIFAGPIFQFWKRGGPFSTVRGDEWQSERTQVDTLRKLSNPTVVEFRAGTFWTGYSTYRVHNFSDGWAIATFKTPTLNTLCDFRIRDEKAVQIGRLDGALTLTVEHKVLGRSVEPPGLKANLRPTGCE